jgi:glycerophosphoryl diester phosphodiesterase
VTEFPQLGGDESASAPFVPTFHTTRIAHRAGNDRTALRLAVEAQVDWIEIDLWYAGGRLIARHERGLWRLPIVYDKWHMRVVRERPLDLAEIVRLSDGGPRLFIDLKGTARRLPQAIVETLRRLGAVERAAVCGQFWPPLDAIKQSEPRIQVFHSLGRPEHVNNYALRLEAEHGLSGISIGHWLLTPELVAGYHARAVQVFAWTVNDPAIALRLVGWGVDGIISDNLGLLNALR